MHIDFNFNKIDDVYKFCSQFIYCLPKFKIKNSEFIVYNLKVFDSFEKMNGYPNIFFHTRYNAMQQIQMPAKPLIRSLYNFCKEYYNMDEFYKLFDINHFCTTNIVYRDTMHYYLESENIHYHNFNILYDYNCTIDLSNVDRDEFFKLMNFRFYQPLSDSYREVVTNTGNLNYMFNKKHDVQVIVFYKIDRKDISLKLFFNDMFFNPDTNEYEFCSIVNSYSALFGSNEKNTLSEKCEHIKESLYLIGFPETEKLYRDIKEIVKNNT